MEKNSFLVLLGAALVGAGLGYVFAPSLIRYGPFLSLHNTITGWQGFAPTQRTVVVVQQAQAADPTQGLKDAAASYAMNAVENAGSDIINSVLGDSSGDN